VHHFAGALGGEDADKKSGSKVHPSRDARFRMRAVPPMPRLQVGCSVVLRRGVNQSMHRLAAATRCRFVTGCIRPCGLERSRARLLMPTRQHLQVRIQGLPAQALYGEVMRCLIEVTNVGAKPAASLRLAASHPAFFGILHFCPAPGPKLHCWWVLEWWRAGKLLTRSVS
jgi:hypothetical protein